MVERGILVLGQVSTARDFVLALVQDIIAQIKQMSADI